MRRVIAALAMVIFIGTSCASTPSTGPAHPGTSSTSSAPSTTTTAPRPSAMGDLAPYFAAAATTDQKLKAAARAVNGAIGTSEITLSASTFAAIAAADPTPASRVIPPGLTPEVMSAVLTVQSDLASRYWAMRGASRPYFPGGPTTIPLGSDPAHYLLMCLGGGSQAAALFATDLAAAEAVASQSSPAVQVDPSSHTAGDLAIWLQLITGLNSGCESCGGERVTSLDPITWHYVAPLTTGGNPWDGDVGGLLFSAHYSASGWTIQLNAC
ncbi:MAG TPA: hypothetical protein VMF60_04225 [Acidimicrobiales bacterium]|nr:hypothetical protein [Acidimicrobiales bacterium]